MVCLAQAATVTRVVSVQPGSQQLTPRPWPMVGHGGRRWAQPARGLPAQHTLTKATLVLAVVAALVPGTPGPVGGTGAPGTPGGAPRYQGWAAAFVRTASHTRAHLPGRHALSPSPMPCLPTRLHSGHPVRQSARLPGQLEHGQYPPVWGGVLGSVVARPKAWPGWQDPRSTADVAPLERIVWLVRRSGHLTCLPHYPHRRPAHSTNASPHRTDTGTDAAASVPWPRTAAPARSTSRQPARRIAGPDARPRSRACPHTIAARRSQPTVRRADGAAVWTPVRVLPAVVTVV